MNWKDFEENAPELAALAYEKLNRKIAYLATIKKDGSPRLHPVTPFIGNGMLFIFTEPSSPKIQDLRQDGRYAMHCSVGRDGPLIEVLVSGEAVDIADPGLRREQAESIAASPVVQDSYALFEFLVRRVLVVEYDEQRKPVVRRWRSEKTKSGRGKSTEV
jgi:hypothetical protein